MTDIEVALELLKLVLSRADDAIECSDSGKLLALYRKCLAAVRVKQE